MNRRGVGQGLENEAEDTEIFVNRTSAGRALARKIADLCETDPAFRGDRIVIALPRGGVPVAMEVARVLDAPLDLVLVRKIGLPHQPELAAAAIVNGEAPIMVRNEEIIRSSGLSEEALELLAQAQLEEISRRRDLYLAGRPHIPVTGKIVIVIDDGIATGATALAAVRALRQHGPKSLTLAVPVAPGDNLGRLRTEVDRFVALEEHTPFFGVGAHYQDFGQVSDAEVRRLMMNVAASP